MTFFLRKVVGILEVDSTGENWFASRKFFIYEAFMGEPLES